MRYGKLFIGLISGMIMGIAVSGLLDNTHRGLNDQLSASRLIQSLEASRQLEQTNRQLKARANELQRAVRENEFQIAQRDMIFYQLYMDLEGARLSAGLTNVRGGGIEVVVQDAPRSLLNDPLIQGDVSLLLVHDEDLMDVLNALWAGGAEAVSVNGVRIGNRMRLRCNGPTIRIMDVYLAPPYIIQAIGDKRALTESLMIPSDPLGQSVYHSLTAYGLRISIAEKDDMHIEKLSVPVRFEHAVADKE